MLNAVTGVPPHRENADVVRLDLDAGLTNKAIKLLRDGLDISFHRQQYPEALCDRIIVWGKGSRRQDAMLEATRVIDTRTRWTSTTTMVTEAYASVGGGGTTWATIASLLKVNDILWLEWRCDSHSNAYCRGAKADHTFLGYEGKPLWREDEWRGLHGDSLELVIERPAKRAGGRPKMLRFLLYVSICPDNSARMIQK